MKPRFTVGTTIEGFEVIDRDGRPVSPTFEIRKLAAEICSDLNDAASRGRLQLRHAFGAMEFA